MAQTSDYFLTDIDIKNLDVCEHENICQYHNDDFDYGILKSCRLQQLLNTPCDRASGIVLPGGSITNKKKNLLKKVAP